MELFCGLYIYFSVQNAAMPNHHDIWGFLSDSEGKKHHRKCVEENNFFPQKSHGKVMVKSWKIKKICMNRVFLSGYIIHKLVYNPSH